MTRGMINRPDLQGRNNQGFCRGGGIKKGVGCTVGDTRQYGDRVG